MLDPNPESRISATEALKHEFFEESTRIRRASQILLEDLDYEQYSRSEIANIDSHESLDQLSNKDNANVLE